MTRTQWEATLMDTRGTTQGSATILFNTFHGSLHPSEMREVPLTLVWQQSVLLGFTAGSNSPISHTGINIAIATSSVTRR